MDAVVVITEFKNQLKARGYAEATIEGYRKNLDQFTRYLEEENITDLRTVTKEIIHHYQVKVMAEPIAMESKALKVRPVKRLFEYLTETNKLLINPTEGIVETTRRNRKIGVVLTIEEMKRLLSQPNLSLKTHIRDRAVMEMLYSTGIRLDELLGLEVYHVDLKENVLYIRKGKGRKERVVPLGKEAARYLREYLEKVRPHHGKRNPKERRLFLNHSGYPLTPEIVRGCIRNYRLTAGIKKPVSPHTFRRSCATHLVQRGADIRYIQELLGHRNLRTTQTYTKVMPKEVKETHERTHPGIQ
jgi:site-specific recombinase XerD